MFVKLVDNQREHDLWFLHPHISYIMNHNLYPDFVSLPIPMNNLKELAIGNVSILEDNAFSTQMLVEAIYLVRKLVCGFVQKIHLFGMVARLNRIFA